MTPGKPVRRRERLWLDAGANGRETERPVEPPRGRRRARDRLSADARYVIDLCDRVLGEEGWRDHRFRWLNAEGTLLSVDAYYPSRRLVVQYRDRPHRGDEDRERLIPSHGLTLVTVSPSTLGLNNGRPRRPERDLAVVSELLAGAAPRQERAGRDAGPASRSWQLQIAALGLGLMAAGLLLATGALTGRQFWLDVGGALVAFGLAFDVYARVLGVLAARAAREEGWAWACALLGSPAVAAHAALRRTGHARPELDTLLGLVVLTLVVAMLVASISGIGTRA